jgi:hypothetical protein
MYVYVPLYVDSGWPFLGYSGPTVRIFDGCAVRTSKGGYRRRYRAQSHAASTTAKRQQ